MLRVKDASCKYIGKSVYIHKYCNAGSPVRLSGHTSCSCSGLWQGFADSVAGKTLAEHCPQVRGEAKKGEKRPCEPRGENRKRGQKGSGCQIPLEGPSPMERSPCWSRETERPGAAEKAMTLPFPIPLCCSAER